MDPQQVIPHKAVTIETINPHLRRTRYDVRGEIYLAAVKRSSEGKEVIYTNVGNPHALGQAPLTFNRQVMSLVVAPVLLAQPSVRGLFPLDAFERASQYLHYMKGGVGAYSDSKGNPHIRSEVARFIERESGYPSDPERIFISNGASECVRMLLFALIRGEADAVMVPIPQYPLYSASISLYGGQLVPYYLDEEKNWALDIKGLSEALSAAKGKGIAVRALVFINPGNPTGQCLSEDNLRDLVRFCYDDSLLLVADEVYQENVYDPNQPFISCRKVLGTMPEPYRSGVALVSLHSVSKGVYGECGLRGGYMELLNIDLAVVDEVYKMASINLSPNTAGQVAVGLMCNPPKVGDPSYAQYALEKSLLTNSLRRRARLITDAFNCLEGVTCQETSGAMYSFPKITIPPAAIRAAQESGKEPDVFYCLRLLEETGLSCVPGSGFRQARGTYHFRTTILPSEDKFQDIIARFTAFHKSFMKKYSDPAFPASRL